MVQLTARSVTPSQGTAKHETQEGAGAYYVDLTSDEEEGAAAEAQIDHLLGDLEVLFQEQLAALVEDAAEQ